MKPPIPMDIKEKLKKISNDSPSNIKGLIAIDAMSWGDPADFFHRVKMHPFNEQPYVFRYMSFKFLLKHRDTFADELLAYNQNIKSLEKSKDIWETFCNAVIQVAHEVGL